MDLFLNQYSKNYCKKFKERLKDRHKINGIKFSYPKKEDKKYFVKPRKKEKEQKNIYSEYEEFMLLQNYNKLKHHIFVHEQKEKEKIKKEQELFKKINNDFNYTNIYKIIQDFLGLKDNDKISPFNYDIKSGRMAIERADRNIKVNRINEMLKRIILHFIKINSKLNIKKENSKNEYLSQETVNEIKRKIIKHKKKLQSKYSKLIFKKENLKIDDKSSNDLMYIKSKSIKSINNRRSKSSFLLNDGNGIWKSRSNNNFNDLSNNNRNSLNYKNISSSSSYVERKPSIAINSEKILTNDSINYMNNKKDEYNNSSEDLSNKKNIKRNSYYFNESKEKKIINNVKKMYNLKKGKKSRFSFIPNLLKNDIDNNTYNGKIKRQNSIILIEDKSKFTYPSSLKRKTQFSIKSNDLKNKRFYRPKSCINIEYIKKEKDKNESNWINSNNKKLNRNNSCFNRRKSHLKVKNLPLYTTKISDLINEYNRIKKNSKKLKINYKEKHFSTYEEIDNIIKTKEDMLMFLLKQKYFNCRFPQKKIKSINPKIIFLNKMKEYIDLTEERPSILIDLEKNLKL